MVPALTPLAQGRGSPRTRFGAVYIPNGAIIEQWIPTTTGAGFEFTPILKPLEPFKDSARRRHEPDAVASGQSGRRSRGERGRVPDRRAGRSAPRPKTCSANTTIDQVVAQQIGQDTPFPSLEVATEDFTGYVGACSPGFSCAYMNTISWSSPTTPLPMEINPRVVFERLFGQRRHGRRSARRACSDEQSMLDSIVGRGRGTLQRGLGARDRSAPRASTSTTCAKSSGASSAPKRTAAPT